MPIQRTTFRISQMDCSSEEQLIRMKLGGIEGIKHLSFNIDKRELQVDHTLSPEIIRDHLHSLNLGESILKNEEVEESSTKEEPDEKQFLVAVLVINASLFVVEMISGIVARSMGLIADSLDMLADSFVYLLALSVVGGAIAQKKKIATISGIFQLVLAILGLLEVIRRFTGSETVPAFSSMITISILALLGNIASLIILKKSRNQEAHMKASMIFTSNDVIANLGVILAGVLVYFSESRIPDLAIGGIVFLLVARGAFRILQLGK